MIKIFNIVALTWNKATPTAKKSYGRNLCNYKALPCKTVTLRRNHKLRAYQQFLRKNIKLTDGDIQNWLSHDDSLWYKHMNKNFSLISGDNEKNRMRRLKTQFLLHNHQSFHSPTRWSHIENVWTLSFLSFSTKSNTRKCAFVFWVFY